MRTAVAITLATLVSMTCGLGTYFALRSRGASFRLALACDMVVAGVISFFVAFTIANV